LEEFGTTGNILSSSNAPLVLAYGQVGGRQILTLRLRPSPALQSRDKDALRVNPEPSA